MKESIEGKNEELRNKIITYTASGLLATVLIGGIGLEIHDKKVDHTKEICPITKILDIFDKQTENSKGIKHQITEMESDYEDKGIEVEVSFIPVVQRINEDGTKTIKSNNQEFVSYFDDGTEAYLKLK